MEVFWGVFSVRGVRPGGGLLFSGPFPCWWSLLWRSAELHVTEDIEITGNCPVDQRSHASNRLLTRLCHWQMDHGHVSPELWRHPSTMQINPHTSPRSISDDSWVNKLKLKIPLPGLK